MPTITRRAERWKQRDARRMFYMPDTKKGRHISGIGVVTGWLDSRVRRMVPMFASSEASSVP